MNNYSFFLGWDVSKNDLDYCLRQGHDHQIIDQGKVANKKKDIRAFLKKMLKTYGTDSKQVFCCIERTGMYGDRLTYIAFELGLTVHVADALRINKANQRRMDKTDALDAQMICTYGMEKAYALTPWSPPSVVSRKIGSLHRRRKNLIKSRQSIATSLKNSMAWEELAIDPGVVAATKKAIQQINEVIALIDEKISGLIVQDSELKVAYDRLSSVSGFGPKNSIVVLLETDFFRKITTAGACANYAGLRPTEYSSGTSVRKRKRTSKKVNKALKTAFHQAAFSCSNKKPIFIEYYKRKRAEGKTHLQVINAIRNKLCRALYACIRNEVMYEENLQVSLLKS